MNQTASHKADLLTDLLIGGARLPWPADLLLLGARLYGGYTIASAGLDKLPVPDWMVDQVAQVGFPAVSFFALMACLTEFAGGVLLFFGLLTRPSAAFLAITMGVASFGFQKVTPITGMHIAQGFFWLFVVFMALGGGRFSVDQLLRTRLRGASGRSLPALAAAAALALVPTGYGLFLEFGPRPEPAPPAPVEITSMSVPGSFNDWDLTSHPLERQDDGTWAGTVAFEAPGPVAFKFAANESWNVNLGDDDPGTAGFPVAGTGEPGGENIAAYIPEAGSYRFTVDPEAGTYRLDSAERHSDPAPVP